MVCTYKACKRMWIGGTYSVVNNLKPKWKESVIISSDYNYNENSQDDEYEYNFVIDGTFSKGTSVVIECKNNHTCLIKNGFEITTDNLRCYGECIIKKSLLPKIVPFALSENCSSWYYESFIFALPFCMFQTLIALYWLQIHKIIDYCYTVFFIRQESKAYGYYDTIPKLSEYSLENVLKYTFDDQTEKTEEVEQADTTKEKEKENESKDELADGKKENSDAETDETEYEMVPTPLKQYLDAKGDEFFKNVFNFSRLNIPQDVAEIIFLYMGINNINCFYAKYYLYPKYRRKYMQFVNYFILYHMIIIVLFYFSIIVIFAEYFTWRDNVRNSIENGFKINDNGNNIIAVETRDWHFYQSFAAMLCSNFGFIKISSLFLTCSLLNKPGGIENFERTIQGKIDEDIRSHDHVADDVKFEEKSMDGGAKDLNQTKVKSRSNSVSKDKECNVNNIEENDSDLIQIVNDDTIMSSMETKRIEKLYPIRVYFSQIIALQMNFGPNLIKNINTQGSIKQDDLKLIKFVKMGNNFWLMPGSNKLLSISYYTIGMWYLIVGGMVVPVFVIPGLWACILPLMIFGLYCLVVQVFCNMLINPKWQVSDIFDKMFIKWYSFENILFVLFVVIMLFSCQLLVYGIYRLATFGAISLYRGNLWVSIWNGDTTDWSNKFCTNENWIVFPQKLNFGTFILWITRWIA